MRPTAVISGLQLYRYFYTFILLMKLHAFILLMSILVYTTELVKIPLIAGSNQHKTMCCKAKMKCPKKMPGKGADNCDGNNCINCPLGNIFTLQSISAGGVVMAGFKKEFVPLKTNIVPGVYSKVWRPPVVS